MDKGREGRTVLEPPLPPAPAAMAEPARKREAKMESFIVVVWRVELFCLKD